MQSWIGPAIIAAVVSGIVSAVGWFVASWQAMRFERRRRDEKVRDFQVALRAEIASDLLNMQVANRGDFLATVTAEYERDPAYYPFVPRLASNVVFDAVVTEIQLLPEAVIRPVIRYARLRQTLERFIEDLRSETARTLAPQRQLTMYADYLATLDRLEALAGAAVAALDAVLNSSAAGPSTQVLAAGSDGASAVERDVP